MYTFDRDPFCFVRKVYIKAYDASFTVAEPLTFPTKSYASLIELNINAVDSLTTDLANELACKQRLAD